MTKRAALYLAIPALFVLVAYFAFYRPSPAEDLAEKEQLAIERSQHIHDALYRWYHSGYSKELGFPASFDEMLAAGWSEMPINPFSRRPMQAVRFDAPSPGDFSYMPRKLVWRYKDGRVESIYEDFILLVYGPTGRYGHTNRNRGVQPYLWQSLPVIHMYSGWQPNRGNLPDDMTSRRYESWTHVFKRAGYVELAKALEPLDVELQLGRTEP